MITYSECRHHVFGGARGREGQEGHETQIPQMNAENTPRKSAKSAFGSHQDRLMDFARRGRACAGLLL